ncbi:MAG TPA: hypothetical protein VEA19_00445 [Actinomycetota bacterium]|nr:hypothetical protein [Actinomycetota bacterium]
MRSLATITDRSGDAGLQVPGYADLAEVSIQSRAERARVVVDVASAFPGRLEEGEVIGVGVDFFVGDGSESDYQLFVDGSDEGWFAYLQTPEGFVRYPGSFSIGGRRMAFDLPWGSLGNARRANVSAFVDWSAPGTPLNRASEDRAPDEGRASFSR